MQKRHGEGAPHALNSNRLCSALEHAICKNTVSAVIDELILCCTTSDILELGLACILNPLQGLRSEPSQSSLAHTYHKLGRSADYLYMHCMHIGLPKRLIMHCTFHTTQMPCKIAQDSTVTQSLHLTLHKCEA